MLWRRRYHEAGIGGLLQDASRPGRKKAISIKKVETLVNATVAHDAWNDATHWSTRAITRFARGERGDRATHLERARAATAPREDVQAES